MGSYEVLIPCQYVTCSRWPPALPLCGEAECSTNREAELYTAKCTVHGLSKPELSSPVLMNVFLSCVILVPVKKQKKNKNKLAFCLSPIWTHAEHLCSYRHAFSLHTCWWLLHWRWPPLGYQHLSFISILVFAKYPWQISFFSSPFFSVICWYWYAGPGIARKFTPTFTCSQFKISPVLWWCALLMLNMNWPTQFPPSNK